MKFFPILTCAFLVSSFSAYSQEMISANNRTTSKQQPAQQKQGECLECYCPAFNAPAAIDVNYKTFRCHRFSDSLFIDASLIYWYAGEEGLALASNGIYSGSTLYFPVNSTTVFQSSNYKPGFKVGVGVVGNHEWVFHGEYTWYRSQNNTNTGAPPSDGGLTAGTTAALSGSDVWVVNDWFLQGTSAGQAIAGSNISSTWHLSMDLIDAVAGRPFYQGRCVTISPFAGLRVALIRQLMTVQLTESPLLFGSAFGAGTAPGQPIESNNHSNSWAIGPRVGFDGNCLLPMGFRFEGDFAASLLYTRYTSVKHSEDSASTAFNAGPYTALIDGYSCLRPSVEMGLGIGWGRYLSCQDYHIDFSLDYDFMLFWSQNMIRKLLDDTLTGTGPSAADLYLHGLTITGRFDF